MKYLLQHPLQFCLHSDVSHFSLTAFLLLLVTFWIEYAHIIFPNAVKKAELALNAFGLVLEDRNDISLEGRVVIALYWSIIDVHLYYMEWCWSIS